MDDKALYLVLTGPVEGNAAALAGFLQMRTP